MKCMPLSLIPVAVLAGFLSQVLVGPAIVTAGNPLIDVVLEPIGNRNANGGHASKHIHSNGQTPLLCLEGNAWGRTTGTAAETARIRLTQAPGKN